MLLLGGGGAYGGTLHNCILAGNSDSTCLVVAACAGTLYNCTLMGNCADNGGGVYGGTFYNCALIGDRRSGGGGSYGGALYNCTLTGNRADFGGGASGSTLYNCIVYYNNAHGNGWNWSLSISATLARYRTLGQGNITNEPQFVDAAAGDYRLLPSSPCIDAGINQDWMFDATDLAGNPRMLNGRVDMGAYEFAFQGNFRVWLQGPYNTNANGMTTALNDAGKIR